QPRRRPGEGQHIDLSQAEASLHFLGPALLDHAVNDRLPARIGNRDSGDAPQGVYPAPAPDRWGAIAVARALGDAPPGVYPAAGRDPWVGIAVDGELSFAALCDAMEQPALAADSRFAS